jgi:hypothetical protein
MSRTPISGRSRRVRRGTFVAAALSLTLVASACGQQRQPTEYGKDYRENFMLGCTGVEADGDLPPGGEKLASKSYCECVYDGLKDTVPFDEAREFEEQQAEAESGDDIEVPKNIQSVFDGCEAKS